MERCIRQPWIPLVFIVGCYASHSVPRGSDASVDMGVPDLGVADVGVDTRVDTGVADAGACDLRGVECTALPGCLGPSPPETLYCDDVRICLFSDPGDEMAMAIAAVSDRIECNRADSCDFLCGLVGGRFDDEVRSELCAIARVVPGVTIECSIFGP